MPLGPGAVPARGCRARSIDAVEPVLAAKAWHYWISVFLVAGGLLAVVALGIGYLVKVVSMRYPKQ